MDDLREEFDSEKSESQLHKRRKFDTKNNLRFLRRRLFILADRSIGDGDVFDLVLTRPEPVMSDDAYFDLFNSDA